MMNNFFQQAMLRLSLVFIFLNNISQVKACPSYFLEIAATSGNQYCTNSQLDEDEPGGLRGANLAFRVIYMAAMEYERIRDTEEDADGLTILELAQRNLDGALSVLSDSGGVVTDHQHTNVYSDGELHVYEPEGSRRRLSLRNLLLQDGEEAINEEEEKELLELLQEIEEFEQAQEELKEELEEQMDSFTRDVVPEEHRQLQFDCGPMSGCTADWCCTFCAYCRRRELEEGGGKQQQQLRQRRKVSETDTLGGTDLWGSDGTGSDGGTITVSNPDGDGDDGETKTPVSNPDICEYLRAQNELGRLPLCLQHVIPQDFSCTIRTSL